MSCYRALVAFLIFFSANLLARSTSTLDAKLSLQWAAFAKARTLGESRYAHGFHPIDRSSWEKILQIHPAFSAADLTSLSARQDSLARKARDKDRAQSLFAFDRIRQKPDIVARFCAEIPKGGLLHVHPGGTLSEETLAHLLQIENPEIEPRKWLALFTAKSDSAGVLYPSELNFIQDLARRYGSSFRYSALKAEDATRLRELYFLPHGHHLFSRFEGSFSVLRLLLSDHPSPQVTSILYNDFFQRAAREKVTYVEMSEMVSLTPSSLKELSNQVALAKKRFGITEKFLASFNRLAPLSDLYGDALKLIQLPKNPTVIGINLVADETESPALEHAQSLYFPLLEASVHGLSSLRRTIHAGELGDDRNVRDSLILGAERIGHGVRLIHDRIALEYARLHHIPIETSLTSNVRLSAVKDYASNPYLYYLRLGLKVSLSTDDEGILKTDINSECRNAIEHTDINYEELKELLQNSLDTAFASPEEVKPLKARFEKDLAAFETRWKGMRLF